MLHQRLAACDIAREHLSGKGIRIDGDPLNVVTLPSGVVLNALEFVHLFSVFNDSRVHAQARKKHTLDDAPPGFYFTVINTKLVQKRHKNSSGLFFEETGDPQLFIQGLHIDHFFLNEHESPIGLGTLAFSLCAMTAHLAGLSKIQLVAAGGHGYNPRYVGYKVWPRLGFDAELLPGETSQQHSLSECKTVLDVLAVDQAWWDQNGSQRLMAFELAADSASWRKLLSYLSEKLP